MRIRNKHNKYPFIFTVYQYNEQRRRAVVLNERDDDSGSEIESDVDDPEEIVNVEYFCANLQPDAGPGVYYYKIILKSHTPRIII